MARAVVWGTARAEEGNVHPSWGVMVLWLFRWGLVKMLYGYPEVALGLHMVFG